MNNNKILSLIFRPIAGMYKRFKARNVLIDKYSNLPFEEAVEKTREYSYHVKTVKDGYIFYILIPERYYEEKELDKNLLKENEVYSSLITIERDGNENYNMIVSEIKIIETVFFGEVKREL